MTWSLVFWVFGAVLLGLLGKSLQYVWRFWRVMDILNVDMLEILKKSDDKVAIDDYLVAKYREKEQLFRFRILKSLREKLFNEDEENEKEEFLNELVKLLGDSEFTWSLIERIRITGDKPYRRISFGPWTKTWGGPAESRIFLGIDAEIEYKNGIVTEQYYFSISDEDVQEARDVLLCKKILRIY